MERLVAIVGPTATGKSELALHMARSFGGEIVGADSRQVYRFMNIGTSKPTSDQMASVPHHLIDVVNPDEDFNLATYCQSAPEVIKTIQQRERLPLLVGGSGLYVWSVIEGWKMPGVPPDPELRLKLENKARQEGSHVLYQELQGIDPVAASKIHPANIRRIIRALEIHRVMGKSPSSLGHKEAPSFPIIIIGLTMERDELYRRIDARVDNMIREGLVKEVEGLLEMGYSLALPSMSGIGYRQVGTFLQGRVGLPEAIDRIKYETHRLVRHQYAWFRLNDKRVHWLDANQPSASFNEAKNIMEGFLL